MDNKLLQAIERQIEANQNKAVYHYLMGDLDQMRGDLVELNYYKKRKNYEIKKDSDK